MGLLISVPYQKVSAATDATHSCPSLAPLVKKAGLPPVFLRIAWRESKCIENAVGWNYKHGAKSCTPAHWKKYLKTCGSHIASFDSGFWQINSTWYSVTKQICGRTPQQGALMDGWCNARVAKYLYEHGGMSHWKGSSRV